MTTVRVRFGDVIEECWLINQRGKWCTVRRTTKGDDFEVLAVDVDREGRWKVTEEDS